MSKNVGIVQVLFILLVINSGFHKYLCAMHKITADNFILGTRTWYKSGWLYLLTYDLFLLSFFFLRYHDSWIVIFVTKKSQKGNGIHDVHALADSKIFSEKIIQIMVINIRLYT